MDTPQRRGRDIFLSTHCQVAGGRQRELPHLCLARSERAPEHLAASWCARRDAYLPGVQALYRSMQVVGCRHPLIVMHTKGVR